MKLSELKPYTFHALRHRLGHSRPRNRRPMWQVRLSADQKRRKIDLMDFLEEFGKFSDIGT